METLTGHTRDWKAAAIAASIKKCEGSNYLPGTTTKRVANQQLLL